MINIPKAYRVVFLKEKYMSNMHRLPDVNVVCKNAYELVTNIQKATASSNIPDNVYNMGQEETLRKHVRKLSQISRGEINTIDLPLDNNTNLTNKQYDLIHTLDVVGAYINIIENNKTIKQSNEFNINRRYLINTRNDIANIIKFYNDYNEKSWAYQI